ncbi:hypothetical protein Tco_1423164 [Tanacetum coccineum]
MSTYSYAGVQSWEKVQQEKLKAVKARLNFKEASRHSESGTLSERRNLKERLGPRRARSMSGSPELRHDRSKSPRKNDPKIGTVFNRLEKVAGTQKAATRVLALEKQKLLPRNIATKESTRKERKHCRKVKEVQEGIRSQNQRSKSLVLRMTYPNHGYVKKQILSLLRSVTLTSQEPECLVISKRITEVKTQKIILKSFKQPPRRNARQCQPGAICSTPHSPETRGDVKGARECMKISRFVHEITNPELIKQLHDKIPKSVDEMIRVTTEFLRGEVAASNRERKKSFRSWKQQEAGQKKSFKKGSFRSQQRTEQKQDRFTLLTKTPKEILALDKGKFNSPPHQ